RVISQLLTEMDGISTLEDVVVLAATNRPDLIDPAILRPGRFDRLVYVPSPNEEGRLAILKIHTKNMPLSRDVDLKVLASMTKGYSGADLEALCREAALIALRRDINAKEVTMADFQEAMRKIGPSITPDMENWYKGWSQQFKKMQRAAPPLIT
ncbi:MAG: AAA family ATPase, partial [Candidatus Bathyarchaeia archaeon]